MSSPAVAAMRCRVHERMTYVGVLQRGEPVAPTPHRGARNSRRTARPTATGASSSGLVLVCHTCEAIGWWTRRVGDPLTALSDAELGRLRGLRREADRADFLAAHLAVRMVAACYLTVAAGSVALHQRCARCAGPHGKPVLASPVAPGVHLSLAHSQGRVAAAVANGPIGVDLEPVSKAVGAGLSAGAVLSSAELRRVGPQPPDEYLVRAWVAKEALVKRGAFTLDDLSTVDVDLAKSSDGQVDCVQSRRWHQSVIQEVTLSAEGIAVAIAADAPLRVVVLRELELTPIAEEKQRW